jgi:nucleoside-diphosphate-sugar epimerase
VKQDEGNWYSGRRILITGGLGFIGSTLAIRLAQAGARVTVVDSLLPGTGGNSFNLSPVRDMVTTYLVDIRDYLAMERLIAGQEVVFSLAGQVSHLDSMSDPFTDLEINCRSQLALLEACRRLEVKPRVIFASTRQVYGRPKYLPLDEAHPAEPADVNGINKLAAERYYALYSRIYGIKATVLRLTNTYGPRMLVKNNTQTFIGWFIKLAADGEAIELFGGGEQLRDFTYVDDAVDAFLLAGTRDDASGEIYNLGGLEVVSLRWVAESLIQVAGTGTLRLVPFPPERKAIDVGSTYCSFEKIRADLGWEPKIDLVEGLSRTVKYFVANRDEYW